MKNSLGLILCSPFFHIKMVSHLVLLYSESMNVPLSDFENKIFSRTLTQQCLFSINLNWGIRIIILNDHAECDGGSISVYNTCPFTSEAWVRVKLSTHHDIYSTLTLGDVVYRIHKHDMCMCVCVSVVGLLQTPITNTQCHDSAN